MTRVCCVCERVEQGNRWASDYTFSSDERVTHGYCPSCFLVAMAEIAEFVEQKHGLGHNRNALGACA